MAIHAPASRAWRELFDLLVKPVRDALPRSSGALLTIVPHGPLAALAFAGLQDEAGRYLLESFTLHYAPAGAALQFTAAQRRPAARQGRVLLVADPVPPTLSPLDRPLPRLPGARAESRAIAALIPAARVSRFEGDAARESAVREATADKSVLHFATHAIVRDSDPFSSFLALGRAGDDDGLLTAQEIYRLRLDADLIVLSACRSGGGRVTGDGIATFARAFMYAGAPSIVASLWDVADEPTNRLIPAFYRSWMNGASKARALRAAQLALLKELRAGRVQIDTPAGRVSLPDSPVFWAGFALIGEPD
jgi:CHAT domain-containing protein